MSGIVVQIAEFYRAGFRAMVLGRLLWKIILLKLIVIFALAKVFFPDYLATNFSTDQARAEHVLAELTSPRGGVDYK